MKSQPTNRLLITTAIMVVAVVMDHQLPQHHLGTIMRSSSPVAVHQYQYQVNDGEAYGVSFLHNNLDHTGIAFFSERGTMDLVSGSAWELKPIW